MALDRFVLVQDQHVTGALLALLDSRWLSEHLLCGAMGLTRDRGLQSCVPNYDMVMPCTLPSALG